MILTRVDIRDFRSHKRTTVDFEEGISVIVGDNGSGKTSILESINFALFKQKPNVNVDDLIRRGADSTEVTVTFTASGRTFKATRGRKTGKAYGSALYEIDDGETLKSRGEDEITKEIEGILGVGGELFTSAIYIKQGEIDKLISEQAAKRKEHVGKLLGADELERAHEGMKKLVKEYDDSIKRLSHVPEEIEETGQKIKEQEGSLKTLKKELKSSSKISIDVKKELGELQTALKKLEQLKNLEYEKTIQQNKIENLQEKIKEIEKNETELNKTQIFHDRYMHVEKELKSLREKSRKFYELQGRGERLEHEVSNLETRISQLNDALEEKFNEHGVVLGKRFVDFEKLSEFRKKLILKSETKKEKLDKQIDNTQSKISVALGKNKEIERAVFELERAGAKCPVCKGPLDKKHKKELLVEYSQKIEKNLKDVEKWDSSLYELRSELENIEESLAGARSINVKLLKSQIEERDRTEKRAKKIKSDLKVNDAALKGLLKIEKTLQKKEEEKSSLEDKNNRFIAAKSYLRKYLPEKDDFQAEAKSIERQYIKLENKAEKLGGPLDRKKFEKLKIKESELQAQFRDAKVTEGKLESDIARIKDEIGDSKKRLKELKLKDKEREKLSKFLVLLEDIRHLFHKDALQRDLRTKALPIIEAHTKDIFDMFNLPYTDLELTDDFNVVLFGPHGEESVNMLSGGERIASALALRIGIAKALSGSAMELIILDEPTIHLDSQRRQDLVEIIKKLSSIPQTIVVTHDKEFEQAADRLILVEKVRGISKVS